VSSAFCSIQRVADVVGYVEIVSLSFIRRQFVKFSNIKIFLSGAEYCSNLDQHSSQFFCLRDLALELNLWSRT